MIIHLFQVYAFIFGAMMGSFANAIIYRLPRDISIVTPRSRCPQCQTLIRWLWNIPILSFLFLRGRCASCKASIPRQYLLVEVVSAIASFLMFPGEITPLSLTHYFFYFSIFIVFLCLFLIDLEHYILPDVLNLYLFLIFSVYALFYLSWKSSLIGLLIGLAIPSLVAWAFYALRGIHGLGGGDIKLYGILGIYLGPLGVVQNIFASCMLGSLVGGLLILTKRMDAKRPIPFGPFILTVASFQIFFPQKAKVIFSIF